jgi:hypothetical protein
MPGFFSRNTVCEEKGRHNMSLASLLTRLVLVHLNAVMLCLEYIQLFQHYEIALRKWGQVMLASDVTLVGALARQAAEIRQRAFNERDAAKNRMLFHQESCTVCKPKLKISRSAK